MKIIILLTEEPHYINPFIKKIIKCLSPDIYGIYIVPLSIIKGDTILKKISYLITITLISGPFYLSKRMFISVVFLFFQIIPFLRDCNPFSIEAYAKQMKIPVQLITDIHSLDFLEQMMKNEPDLIINQAQVILHEKILRIPKYGSINRHGGLLPKYRGRLAPFWAYLMGEKESGVSIHFIDSQIDNGPILIQKNVTIEKYDTFDTILEKDFQVAVPAMLEAIELIRNGDYTKYLIMNDRKNATYYSSPTIADAFKYRKKMFRKWFFHE